MLTEDTSFVRRLLLVVLSLAVGCAAGCKSAQDRRKTAKYNADGSRNVIERLRDALPQRDARGGYVRGMVVRMQDNLEGVVAMMGRDQSDGAAQRKQAAEEALKFYVEEVKPKIIVLKSVDEMYPRFQNYDVNEIGRLLDQLKGLVDKIDQG